MIHMISYEQAKEQFFSEIEKHPKLSKSKEEIFTAFTFGETKHVDQKRKNSELPYFIHCTSVALGVLPEPDVEKEYIIAALLHDTIEDTATTIEELEEKFGNSVSTIVRGLTKLPASYKEELGIDRYYQEGFFGPILLAAQQFPFIWKIKLSDRLNNLESLWGYASKSKMEEYLWETQQILKFTIGMKTPLKDQIRAVLREHYI